MKGRTTIVVAHRLSTIMQADQILVFKNGRIVERGKHEQLMKAGGEYLSLYRESTNESNESNETNENNADDE